MLNAVEAANAMHDTPKPAEDRDQRASLVLLVVAVFALLGVLYLNVIVIERFRQLFTDLLEGCRLPPLTAMLLAIPKSIPVLAVVLAIGLLVCKEFTLANKRVSLSVNVGAIVCAAGYAALFAAAMYLPLIKLVVRLGH